MATRFCQQLPLHVCNYSRRNLSLTYRSKTFGRLIQLAIGEVDIQLVLAALRPIHLRPPVDPCAFANTKSKPSLIITDLRLDINTPTGRVSRRMLQRSNLISHGITNVAGWENCSRPALAFYQHVAACSTRDKKSTKGCAREFSPDRSSNHSEQFLRGTFHGFWRSPAL